MANLTLKWLSISSKYSGKGIGPWKLALNGVPRCDRRKYVELNIGCQIIIMSSLYLFQLLSPQKKNQSFPLLSLYQIKSAEKWSKIESENFLIKSNKKKKHSKMWAYRNVRDTSFSNGVLHRITSSVWSKCTFIRFKNWSSMSHIASNWSDCNR